MKIDQATTQPMKPAHAFKTARLALSLVLTISTAGCATFFESGPDRRAIQQAPSLASVAEPFDSTVPSTRIGTGTGERDAIIAAADGRSDLRLTARSAVARREMMLCADAGPSTTTPDGGSQCSLFEVQAFEPPAPGDDLRLRPPLRRLWFNHPRLVPYGGDAELGLPDSEILAHRDRVTSRPFRNTYGGFRDQPLFHRDTSRAPATDSTLPEIGPPPPKHTIKTFATLTGLSFVGIGVYAFAPSSFTGVNKDEDVYGEAWGQFKQAWTKPPVFDSDRAVVNYLGHPYFGMNFYLSQRNYGESPLYSFLFSTFMSTAFEYFIESWGERPSITDLIVTPVVGSILGELVYRATQEMRKDGFTKAEKIVLTVINPLYVLQNGYH